ncbi:MAG: LLM class flavin-dependent oxidoreductase [Thaumarchaeota archaeon]|nr:LLM class flavin-dependent oxidoreductase [Nitrososphaerota archaeon]
MIDKMGITFGGEVSLPQIVEYSKQADAKGFDSVWMAEHYCLRDAFTSMAAAAAVTEKIRIGSGVVNPYTRSSVLTAMSIACIDELSRGRVILGIGSTTRFWGNLGVVDDKPIATLRQHIEVVRRMLAGETVNISGRRENLSQIRLGFQPNRKTIPVYVGGVQKKMLQMAGEIGEGAILSNLSTIDHVNFAMKQIREGAAKTNRRLDQIEVVCYAMTWLSDDAPKAMPQVKKQIAALLAVPGREILFGEEASKNPKVAGIMDAMKRGKTDEAISLITDDVLNSITISGTPQQCAKRFEEYRQAGVNVMVLRPVVTSPGKLIDTFASK